MNLRHTPTPWTPRQDQPRNVASVQPGGTVPVAVFANTIDAAFAMRAANSHADLIAALKGILGIARAATLHSGGEHNRKRIAAAEAALAAAAGAS
jgi:hypothetical protein